MAPMAWVRGVAILALVVVVWIAEGPGVAVAQSPDGLPRPFGYAVDPTTSYGPTPPCLLNNVAVTCDWYGFASTLNLLHVELCLNVTRTVLANTTLNPPGSLQPYEYYYLNYFVFNTVNNNSYCLYGCFDLSPSTPAAAPGQSQNPPPPPPAPASAPAPDSTPASTPAPDSAPDSPPPPGLIAPSTESPSSLNPTPVASSPPAPPNGTPRIFNLNGAGFLQPTGLLSFMISAALLIFNGLVAF